LKREVDDGCREVSASRYPVIRSSVEPRKISLEYQSTTLVLYQLVRRNGRLWFIFRPHNDAYAIGCYVVVSGEMTDLCSGGDVINSGHAIL